MNEFYPVNSARYSCIEICRCKLKFNRA